MVELDWRNTEFKGHRHEEVEYPISMHGAAIDEVVERPNGTLWVHNGEYASLVNYCPICGYEAEEKME